MKSAKLPDNEQERLQALVDYCILDTDPEPAFDDLTELASDICAMPIALVSLIDGTRQWFKSHHGLDASETPRELAFCAHAILDQGIFEVVDSRQDERFSDNPLVTDSPHVIAYTGVPLRTPLGFNIGTLCVIDNEPHQLSDQQKRHLHILAQQVIVQLELQKKNREKREAILMQQSLLQENERQNQELIIKNDNLRVYDHVVAHDLRAPLRGIRFYADSMAEDLRDGDEVDVQGGLKGIANLTDKANTLIRKILEYSVAGESDGDYEDLRLGDCVEEASKILDAVITETQAIIVNECESTIVRAIPFKVTQLCQNIIVNALTYQAQGNQPRLRIYTRVDEDKQELHLCVEDNGIGIEPNMREEVFAPFRRLHGASSAYQGSGIGLSICRRITEIHGWTIRAEASPSGGSLFVVTIPQQTVI